MRLLKSTRQIPSRSGDGEDRRIRRARRRGRRSEAGIVLILLGFIILPSGLLGYLGWRAIEKERSYSQERLKESYRGFARLAGREIDQELRDIEAVWAERVEEAVGPSDATPSPDSLALKSGQDSLIATYFLLPAPGIVTYPLSPHPQETPPTGGWEKEAHLRERETFERLATRGEDLEYHDADLAGATTAYQEILAEVSNPQLRAMAMSYVGRAQLKNGEWQAALDTFRGLLERYPEARDLNRMYLRFLAQYQIAVALDSWDRDQEAIETLLKLNQDLLKRSDAINTLQYSYYLDLIQDLAPRLLGAPHLRDRDRYEQAFHALKEQNKKRISQKYYIQLLDAELNKMVIRRRHYNPRLHYLSDRTEGEPFLLVYRPLPDPGKVYVTGLIAAQIDLARLRNQLFPVALRNLESSDQVGLALLGAEGGYIIGTDRPNEEPIAVQTLAPPFDFWQVAVYPRDVPGALKRLDLRTTLGLWLISLLLMSILLGAYVFIRRARREAYLSHAQTSFVSNVSHELRTPLSSIKMFAELLEMQMSDSTKVSAAALRKNALEYLEIIRRECERLGRLIENVLEFSKMEHHTKRYHFEYHDLGEILRLSVESFRPNAESNGFTLELAVEEPLPDLRVDADAVSQVMLNLLGNAVQYSDEVKEIRVRAFREGTTVAIEVSDRGIGIAPEELTKVFEKFYSGRQRMDSRPNSGLGLGLTLARSIARAHGGDIRVQSEYGKGSTFTVTLPVSPEEEEAGGSRFAEPPPRMERMAGRSR